MRTPLLLSLGLVLAGCEATLGSDPPDASDTSGDSSTGSGSGTPGTIEELRSACDDLGDAIHPGPAPIRRLTREQYERSTRDLFGDGALPEQEFPPEARALGYHEVAQGQTVSLLLVEAYQKAAQNIAATVSADLDGLLGCAPEESSCVNDFVDEFGSRAYRRPLNDSERQRLMAVFEWGRDNQSVSAGVEMVIEVLLQSPDFLYRPEFGDEEVEEGVMRLSSYEMATRLSYLLLGSLPDSELMDAASRDELQTSEQIAEHATRLLEGNNARELVVNFHTQWLHLEGVEHIERDASIYEGYNDAIPHLLREETEAFVEYALFEDDGTLKTLLSAPYTVVNAPLAEFYGLPAPDGSAFERTADDPKRAGLLTQGSLLAHHAQSLQTSPTHRGKFIRESLLCQFPPPPPDDLIIIPPELDPSLTTRERFAAHNEQPSCANCHKLMDPLGLALEHFDPVGRYRETENGLTIDASGEIVDTDVDGTIDGAVDLAQSLAASEQVATCMTIQWLRYAYGRSETPSDACSLQQLGEELDESGKHVPSLVQALTRTDAFLYREKVQP